MKYMRLIYDDEKGWARRRETERQQAMVRRCLGCSTPYTPVTRS